MSEKKLKFIAISGTTGATENLYIYEYDKEIIIVDCGVGFPTGEMFGVDLVIPDFSYLEKNSEKIKALFITHGHEDHLGAVPFLLKRIKSIPIFATKLTAGFIKDKIIEHKIDADIKVFNPDQDVIKLGNFKITPFRVSHSVPDGVGLSINTPEGNCFHVPDYKFDWTPVNGVPFDIQKAARLASGGVLMLASDALGSTTPGHTESEKTLEHMIRKIITESKGRVFITTVSSNISRMQQVINVAKDTNRKVVFVGRSIDSKSDIAQKLGYLHFSKSQVVDLYKSRNYKDNQLIYIISGCYGQPGSALYRAVLGEHKFLKINSKDTVVFSADPAPPGSKVLVDNLVDKLLELGSEVHYYDLQENLHVSGHGSQEDIKFLFGIVKPKYFIPIGGTLRHMRGYREIAENMGAKSGSVFELSPGSVVEFSNGSAKKGKSIKVRDVLVDGLGIGDVGSVVLRDRQKLSEDGFVIALIQFDKIEKILIKDPELISRGLIFEKNQRNVLNKAVEVLKKSINNKKDKKSHVIRSVTIESLEQFFVRELDRRPMVLPVIVEI